MVNSVHYSSNSAEWGTPRDLFDQLDAIFNFQIDAAAASDNAKCTKYWIKDDNAVSFDWVVAAHLQGVEPVIWLNPPYGAGEKPCQKDTAKCKKKKCRDRGYHISTEVHGISTFMRHAADQADNGATVVALIPARTESKWFFDSVWDRADALVFIRGRLCFEQADNDNSRPAPFPSVIAIYGQKITQRHINKLSEVGRVILL